MQPSVEKQLSKLLFRFLGNGSEKETRALLCQKKADGGLEMPNLAAKIRSAKALWVSKSIKTRKAWTKAFKEQGIDWKSESALATVRENHQISGFAGECVSEWYRTIALTSPSHVAHVWPYITNPTLSKTIKKKCPKLTFTEAQQELPNNLNFLEKAQVKAALPKAELYLSRIWEQVRYESKQSLQRNLNCIKWNKPRYNKKGEVAPIGEGKVKDHQQWLEQQTLPSSITSLCTQRSIYWLHIKHIIPPTHPFRTKMNNELGQINWAKIDSFRISIYSRLQAFQWRSTHGKLYANRDLCRMGIKSEAKCNYCDQEQQTVRHLYMECQSSQKLFACFERHNNLSPKLSEAEKLIGIDPKIERSKLIIKKLGILRRAINTYNHKDETLRWGDYIDLIERIYTLEYAISDRNNKVLQHLKHWEK